MQNLPFALAFRGRGNSSRQNTTKTYSNRSLVPSSSSTGFPLHSWPLRWGQKTRKNKPKTRSFTFWLFLRVEETLNSFFPLYFDSATITLTFDVSPRRFFVFVRSRAPTLFSSFSPSSSFHSCKLFHQITRFRESNKIHKSFLAAGELFAENETN